MGPFFHGFLKLLSFLTGISSIAFGGFLCYEKSQEWGWFVFVGIFLMLITMFWCSITTTTRSS